MKTLFRALPQLWRTSAIALIFSLVLCVDAFPQTHASWRAASPSELEAALPARAPVGKERIETEMRTATGIVNDRGQTIAAVLLITAGYAADGKYSHYLLVQAPIAVADQNLAVGTYVVGWSRVEDGLSVHIFEASSGAERATVIAKPMKASRRIESFHIWPPSDRSIIQIGRYMLPYTLLP